MQYNRVLKKKLCENICLKHFSTIKTAKDYNIPIKTIEKWITAFNKDNHCFDPVVDSINDFSLINNFDSGDYSDLSVDDLKDIIMKKDIEICRLKKNYSVILDGTGKKVFVSFSKKNMK